MPSFYKYHLFQNPSAPSIHTITHAFLSIPFPSLPSASSPLPPPSRLLPVPGIGHPGFQASTARSERLPDSISDGQRFGRNGSASAEHQNSWIGGERCAWGGCEIQMGLFSQRCCCEEVAQDLKDYLHKLE